MSDVFVFEDNYVFKDPSLIESVGKFYLTEYGFVNIKRFENEFSLNRQVSFRTNGFDGVTIAKNLLGSFKVMISLEDVQTNIFHVKTAEEAIHSMVAFVKDFEE
jgi:hypothetical protein